MIKILFICHGNICRSVSAEYIMKDIIDREAGHGRLKGMEFYIDSAATSTEEIGNSIYPPMRQTLAEHNIPIGNHRARQVKSREYDEFDLIIGMDEENMYYLGRILGEDSENKIHYLMEYTDTPKAKIEDPWYTRNFEKAYQDIRKGCEGLFENLMSR